MMNQGWRRSAAATGAALIALMFSDVSPTVVKTVTVAAPRLDAGDSAHQSGGAVFHPDTVCRVTENDRFLLEYDEQGMDIYLTDKRSGKLWSNAVDTSYYTQEVATPNLLTQLMTVRTAASGGSLTQIMFTDLSSIKARADVATDYSNDELTLRVKMTTANISFTLRFWLDEAGLNYEIPGDSLQENGTDMLVSIQMMPTFGAAVSAEDGYIFLPDGSGSLVHFTPYDSPNAQLTNYPIYGVNVQDLSVIDRNNAQAIYNMMLPVFGICHHDGAALVAITEGDADASINLAPGGYQLSKLNRIYFSFEYRSYSSTKVNGQDYVHLIPYLNAGTRAAKVFILDDTQNSYSDMAVAYRTYLEQEGKLPKAVQESSVPTSIELFMGASETGFFFDKLVTATTYAQAQSILEQLRAEDVPSLRATLMAWGKGGYGTLPTSPSAESRFGGQSRLSSLIAYCQEQSVPLFLNADFINADSGTGSFNKRSDVIRSYTGSIVTQEDRYILNPTRVLEPALQNTFRRIQGASLRLDMVGSLLTYDYSKANPTSRQVAADAYAAALQKAQEQMGTVAVSGGNQYVLPYADFLSDIPDTHSNYFVGDTAVPFYQMVVHGHMMYTSSPGNLTSDFQIQKLQWVEMGSAPSFRLTWDNPVVLNDSSYNQLFSSQFSVWEETIQETSAELNRRLGRLWSQRMMRHETVDGLTKVTYEDGSTVWINYTEETITSGGIAVPSRDYVVTEG